MTSYHLKFWSKNSGRTSNPLISALEIDRIYVNANDRSSLGYIERRMTSRERGTDSYYDRHRSAKGDTVDVASDTITITLSTEAVAAIKAAIVATEPQWAKANLDDYQNLFQAMKSFARGIDCVASAARRKALKAAAAAFVVELVAADPRMATVAPPQRISEA